MELTRLHLAPRLSPFVLHGPEPSYRHRSAKSTVTASPDPLTAANPQLLIATGVDAVTECFGSVGEEA